MSCEIKQFAEIADLKQVQEDFGFSQGKCFDGATHNSGAAVFSFLRVCKIMSFSFNFDFVQRIIG